MQLIYLLNELCKTIFGRRGATSIRDDRLSEHTWPRALSSPLLLQSEQKRFLVVVLRRIVGHMLVHSGEVRAPIRQRLEALEIGQRRLFEGWLVNMKTSMPNVFVAEPSIFLFVSDTRRILPLVELTRGRGRSQRVAARRPGGARVSRHPHRQTCAARLLRVRRRAPGVLLLRLASDRQACHSVHIDVDNESHQPVVAAQREEGVRAQAARRAALARHRRPSEHVRVQQWRAHLAVAVLASEQAARGIRRGRRR